jgi:hypothetical protein
MSSPFQVGSRLVFLLCFLATAAGGVEAQKIKVEYDKSVDVSKFKTFAIDPVENPSKPMLRLAIQAAVQDDLTRRGLKLVADNPDLWVQMYGAIDSDFAVSYSDLYYGGVVPPFDYSFLMWGAVPGATTTVVVHKGQLAVDIIDASRKKLIWRGIAKEKLSDQREKLLDQVNTAVEKMFKQYPVKQK